MDRRATDEATRAPQPDQRNGADKDADRNADTRRERIATAAYYRAQRRNFQGDGAIDDWLDAEREIDSSAAAGGVQSEASLKAEGPADISAPAIKERAAENADGGYIDPGAIQHWADELGVSAGTLRVAIERAGPRVADVQRFLAEHGHG